MPPACPRPRGPLSGAVIAHLSDGTVLEDPGPIPMRVDPLVDSDLHLALWCCYEVHNFDGVDSAAARSPDIIGFRQRLESAFETALREEQDGRSLPADPAMALRVIAEWASPPLAATVERSGTIEQLREFAIHRSIHQLKEDDWHSFNQSPVEVGSHGEGDERGPDSLGESHTELFADAMSELDLDGSFGAYLDRLPGTTLATDNLAEMLTLNHRLRGALLGYLALFEMTSIMPMSRYLRAARRLGDGRLGSVERFYEVHVEAEAHHRDLSLARMVSGVMRAEPELAADLVFGAAALRRVEARFARWILRCWDTGRSSLLPASGEA